MKISKELILIENPFSKRAYALIKLWGPVMLITSILILPIQGTTPAFILAFVSSLVTLTSFYRFQVIKIIILSIFFYTGYYLFSQTFNLIYNNPVPSGVALINADANRLHFQIAHLTQTLYLLPGFLCLLYIRFHFNNQYWKYIDRGVILLCVYGIYEWIYFLFSGSSGDFLSNRTFGEDEFSGSLSQKITIAGVSLLRMKSLTGEPSMFAFTLMPFFSYYLYARKTKMMLITGICLLLSTSTSAVLGYFVLFITDFLYRVKNGFSIKTVILYICLFLSVGIFIYIFFDVFEALYQFVSDKVTLSSTSGIARFSSFFSSWQYWVDLPFLSKLFGIGFGTIRSLDLLSTLLVNIGLIGLTLFVGFFLWMIISLRWNNGEEKGLAMALIQILIISLIAVPEFSYLSLWFFVGLSLEKLSRFKAVR